MKNVIIAGASGMVGSLVLGRCLASKDVSSAIALVRKPIDMSHPKLKQVILTDFTDYSTVSEMLEGVDAAFFCLGAYTGQVTDDVFKSVTVDFPVALAKALINKSPQARFCLLSGAGADRSEKSRLSFARYKGMAENKLAEVGLGSFHTFRPSYIYPSTRRKEPNLMYTVSRVLYPIIKLLGKNMSISSSDLALAIVHVGLEGSAMEVLENADILNCLDVQ